MPDWSHAPLHRLGEPGTYMVTAATLYKEHYFRGRERLELLLDTLLKLAKQYEVDLEAWAVFSNHYHWIGRPTGAPEAIKDFINQLHSDTARFVNGEDGVEGRQVWFQYWDTALTFTKSYYARLNYVMENPVRHGVVRLAADYPWCSAGWFEEHARSGAFRMIKSFKVDRLNVYDPFEVVLE